MKDRRERLVTIASTGISYLIGWIDSAETIRLEGVSYTKSVYALFIGPECVVGLIFKFVF